MEAKKVSTALRDAVEARRKDLGYRNVADFVAATGRSSTGVGHLRAGAIRDYKEDFVKDVCATLRWTPDSIDRILAGGVAEPIDEPDAPSLPEPDARDLTQLVTVAGTVAVENASMLQTILELVEQVASDVAELRAEQTRRWEQIAVAEDVFDVAP